MKALKTLLITIAVLLCSTTVSAHDFEVDGIYYNITSDTEMTVEVTYKENTFNSAAYNGYVVIPENVVYNGSNYEVTGIGAHAFYYCIGLINVTIPSSVTSIGNYAFYGCGVNFTKITIPNSVTSIGDYAFYSCDFTEVIIPNSVTSIGVYAFAECFELTSITIPNSVTSIESYAFWNCIHLTSVHITDLEAWCKIIFNEPHSNPLGYAHHLYLKGEEIKNLVIPESVTNIGDNTFSGCYGFTDITIPNSVTSIGNHAFSSCKGLTDITIPNSVTSIEYGTFWGCTGLSNLVIGESVKEIESGAFYGCTNLMNVTIPSSVMKIHPSIIVDGEERAFGAFYGCTNLTNVTIESPKIALLDELYTITWWAPDGTEVEESCNVYFKDIFGDQVTNYILGDKITNIGDLAFLECSNLKNVILPSNITNIGSGMFSGCSSLTDITIPNSVTSIEGSVFSGCSSLTDITIPNSVTSIGGNAFYGCSSLTDITIPNSVTNIGGKAFEGCTSLPVENNIRYADTWAVGVTDKTLTRYTLRENTIGLIGAFSDCASLVRITLPTCLTYIGDYAFASCSTLKSLVLPEGVINIGNHAFDNCRNLTSINIPSGVTNIGNYAFFNCTNLTNINIPSNVTNIGEYAFYDCALTEISIPEGITEIMSASFYGNDFKTLEIPEGVTSIEDYAFWDCNVLSSITIPESVTSIGYNAFPDLKSVTLDSPIIFVAGGLADKFGNTVTEYIIRTKIEEIEDYKFYNYSCLQSITLPETLTTIGEGAFEECVSLDSITIPANVTEIKDYAFSNCTALKYICSEALVPPTSGTTTFDGIDTENCILEVPASAVNAYATTAPWSDFNIKVSLVDGEDYENDTDTEVEVITYTRTLNNLLWNALYVPFEIPMDSLIENYDIAYINAMHSYDMDDNGAIDKMEMEVVKIKEGTLHANYPYLIRAKNEEAKAMEIVVENSTLYAAESVTVDCSSVFTKFEITGTYQPLTNEEIAGCYALSGGTWKTMPEDATLNPFRLYMRISDREGSPVKVDTYALEQTSVTIRVQGENPGTTSIESEEIRVKNEESDATIYNLMGQPVKNPVKGHIYIQGGRKVVW